MLEKVTPVKNPLTVIAIFAGIAEISGTVVLPHIADKNQGTFVWFLMLFPVYLVSLFFVTLWLNHKVLYAPSDFKDEDNFFKSLRPATIAEKTSKLRGEVRQIEGELNIQQDPQGLVARGQVIRPGIQAQARWAEELALYKIAKEMKGELQTEVALSAGYSRRFILDGIVRSAEGITAVEVSYLRAQTIPIEKLRATVQRILSVYQSMAASAKDRFSLVIALVFETQNDLPASLLETAYGTIGPTPFPVQIRVFNVPDLENEIIGD